MRPVQFILTYVHVYIKYARTLLDFFKTSRCVLVFCAILRGAASPEFLGARERGIFGLSRALLRIALPFFFSFSLLLLLLLLIFCTHTTSTYPILLSSSSSSFFYFFLLFFYTFFFHIYNIAFIFMREQRAYMFNSLL